MVCTPTQCWPGHTAVTPIREGLGVLWIVLRRYPLLSHRGYLRDVGWNAANAYCKHMAAVENATDDGTLDAFPSEDEDDADSDDCDCDGLGDFRAGHA
ncbi:hypothetical protein [Haladaptatus halobius]|uniref:hypothetical protein n=1 Tax=Haladaptatus halobius TaxID=2884875 RepID=UPI001D0A966B|nr:hypothetical protein [Haladaptatus halobius]